MVAVETCVSARDPVQEREADEAVKQFKDAERMSPSRIQVKFDRVGSLIKCCRVSTKHQY